MSRLSLFTVANATTAFGEALPSEQVILNEATNELFKLTAAETATDTLTTSSTVLLNGGSVTSVNGNTGVVVLDKTDIGLPNVDNTSDADKPVSTATNTALGLKANIASPTFTGTPAAPTAATGTNTTQIASTAFVTQEIANIPSGGGNKTVFLSGNSGGLTGTGVTSGVIGDYAAALMTDGNDNQASNLNWTTPSDFTSISSVEACWMSFSSGNAFLSFRSRAMAAGEVYNTVPSDSIAAAAYTALSNGALIKTDVTAMINDLTISAGDVLALRFERDGANASDTLENTLYFFGFIVTYS